MASPYAFIAVVLVALFFWHDKPSTKPVTASPAKQEHCVVVNLSYTKYPHILGHAWDAIDKGEPRRMHIDRGDADLHRSESLKGIPTKHGYDRDEYPIAASREGGSGADVRYVNSSENRGAGEVVGRALSKFPDGTCFEYQKRPGR
jgi:hypothetical protein